MPDETEGQPTEATEKKEDNKRRFQTPKAQDRNENNRAEEREEKNTPSRGTTGRRHGTTDSMLAT